MWNPEEQTGLLFTKGIAGFVTQERVRAVSAGCNRL